MRAHKHSYTHVHKLNHHRLTVHGPRLGVCVCWGVVVAVVVVLN